MRILNTDAFLDTRAPMATEEDAREGEISPCPLPNLRHLKAFLLVAEMQSVNRAAERVNLSQPAITQAIARLEKLFGVELFNRHQTGMYITDFGTLLRNRLMDAFLALGAGAGQAAGSALADAVAADPTRYVTASQLNALSALNQSGDFQVAADQLGITATSLHRNIRGLEEQLAAKLVFRDGHAVQFSRSGSVLAQQAKLAMRELELAYEDIDWARGVNRGRLTIGALPLTRSYIAPKALVTLASNHPELRVRLMEGSYPVLLRALCEGDVDVLIGALREPPPVSSVVEEPLFTETLCVVARGDHPLVGAKSIVTRELLGYPWVAPRAGSPARREFERLMSDAGPPLMLEVASHNSVRAILFESDALALLSPEQIRYEVKNGQLAVLPVEWQPQPRTIGYTVRKNWRPTLAQRELIDILQTICGEL